MRRIYLSPDPIAFLSVVFNHTLSFFSVSYDQVRVSDYRTGATTVKERGRTPGASGTPQVYQGSALFQLTRTTRPGHYDQDSWSSVVTSTQGAVTKPWNRCCAAAAVGLPSGRPAPAGTSLAGRRCDLAGIAQTSLSPFPLVTVVSIGDWVYEGLESFGAVSGTITALSIALLTVYRAVADRLFPAPGRRAAVDARGDAGGGGGGSPCGADEAQRLPAPSA
jgi:hypothetical protein